MKKEPLISVLLPLYNEPLSFAKQAIESILNQTYVHWELILLLDNPKNENLIHLMEYYAKLDNRIHPHLNEYNLGLPDTLNKGIELANGEYVARMDGDDISSPDRFEKQITFLLEHPDFDLVGSDAYAINEEGEWIGEYHKLRTDFSQKLMLRYGSINLIHPTWLGTIKIFEDCGYRNFTHCEDFDFMLRAYALGYNFYNIQEKLFSVRIQQLSLRSVSRKYAYEQYVNSIRAREQFKVFKKNKQMDYPALPHLVYDAKDKMRYQSTIPLLNELRESFFQGKYVSTFTLIIRILLRDYRPITYRANVFFVSKLLFLQEKILKK